MAKALSVKRLEAIKPADETRSVPDGVVGGLAVRYGAKGRPTFTLVYRVGGKQKRANLGPWSETNEPGCLTLAGARAKAVAWKETAAGGVDPAPRSAPRRPMVETQGSFYIASDAPTAIGAVTVETAVEMFVKAHVANLRSGDDVKRSLRRTLVKTLGAKPLASVTQADVMRALKTAKNGGISVAGNRARSHARKFFGWCANPWREDKLLEASPMLGIPRPLENEESRDRFLTHSEMRAVWSALEDRPAQQRAAIRLSLLTGARRGEVARMCWKDVDLERREWTITKGAAKNKMRHTVYLSDLALRILQALDRLGPYVFSFDGRNHISRGNLSDTFRDVGPADATLHDLRRTITTWMVKDLKIPHEVADKCLNHSTVISGVAAVYNQEEYADERRAATERWGQYVAKIVAGG